MGVMDTETERKIRVGRRAIAFIAEMREVMKRHGVEEICVEMETKCYTGYSGAHINIEFNGRVEDACYVYGTHEINSIRAETNT